MAGQFGAIVGSKRGIHAEGEQRIRIENDSGIPT
jgi:hypothetical protein